MPQWYSGSSGISGARRSRTWNPAPNAFQELWGTPEAEKGVLVDTDGSSRRVPAPCGASTQPPRSTAADSLPQSAGADWPPPGTGCGSFSVGLNPSRTINREEDGAGSTTIMRATALTITGRGTTSVIECTVDTGPDAGSLRLEGARREGGSAHRTNGGHSTACGLPCSDRPRNAVQGRCGKLVSTAQGSIK